MEKSEIRILIVEDDRSLGLALDKALKKAGYLTQLASSVSQAKTAFKMAEFRGLLVDCMLPDGNGVDLVQELRSESFEELTSALTSGIYKDKNFVRDAQLKTKAKAFFSKPYDLEKVIGYFDQEFSGLIGTSHPPLHQLLAKPNFSPQDRVVAVEKTKDLHGFDLPLVYATLAAQGVRGDLEIKYNESTKSVVGFQDGKIDKVIHHDEESYFGVLLVEKGFTSFEEVEEGLSLVDDKPIGERLVDASSLSPHAIELVQHDQMVIRLSKTISNTSIELSFHPMDRESAVAIEALQLSHFLADWINSKITPGWLDSFYRPWLDHRVVQGPDFAKFDLIKSHSIVKPLVSLLSKGDWPHALQDFMEAVQSEEEEVFRALHFLLLQRVLLFEFDSSSQVNWDGRRNRLKKISSNMHGQNHYEVLGLSTNAKPSEVSRVYQDLAKTLHPDKLPPNAPEDIRQLTHEVFSKITEAYQVLSSDKKREAYLRTLEKGIAEEILQAETMFEQGFKKIQARKYRDARKLFQKALKVKGHRSDLMIYVIWALVLEKRSKVPATDLYAKVESLLDQIAHEDRHSPHYFFVRALYYELKGENNKAYSALKHALALDPKFLEARKEISYLKAKAGKKPISVMTDDLSMVVTRFFKKKSG